MTIIVAHKKLGIASDSLCSYDSGDFYHSHKIYKVDGHLLGLAGSSDDCYKFLNWYRNRDKKKPPKIESFEGLILTPEGKLLEVGESCYCTPIDADYHAAGIGFPYAMAVMDSVKRPTIKTMERAVRAACNRNRWCGIDDKGVRFQPI